MLIDTHAHVNFGVFEKDAGEVIRRALDAGVWMINVGSDFKTSQRAVELAEKYPSGVYSAVGLHPNDFGEIFDGNEYKKLAENPKVAAIGEIGLDYYRIKNGDLNSREKQKELFKKQIELALELNKPIIIHCREAHVDLMEILSSYFFPPKADPPREENLKSKRNGVIHSFSGTGEQAEVYRKLGFKIAFNGIITFSRDYDAVISETPIEDILIETDCPYLTPVPYRGKRNEPLYVAEVAKKLAEIKGISLDEASEKTTENAKKVFGI